MSGWSLRCGDVGKGEFLAVGPDGQLVLGHAADLHGGYVVETGFQERVIESWRSLSQGKVLGNNNPWYGCCSWCD